MIRRVLGKRPAWTTRWAVPCVAPRVVALAILLSGGFLARPANAQTTAVVLEPPRHRQGYYIAGGLNAALSGIWEDGRALGAWPGSGFSLRLGQLLTRRLGLGLHIESIGTTRSPEVASVIGLGVEGQVELLHNLALRGTFGLGVVSLSNKNEPGADLRGTYGAGWALALAYDWFPSKRRLTGGFALTPVAGARVVTGEGASAIVGILGVELTWWTGLPRNQLELPPSEAFKKE